MTDSAAARPEIGGRLTHRRVLHIALPIVVSNATIPILGVVDTGVVGQMGEAAPIGAVGIGAVILSGIYWIFGFLRMGTSGMTAQAYGAGDKAEVAAMLMRALLLGACIGVLVMATHLVWAPFALELSPGSEAVEDLARTYLSIRVWSAPAAIALFGATGWLIALERTRSVLVLQVVMNGLNIGLDFLFVQGFGWGVSGVAQATVIAEWSGFALCLWLCRDGLRDPAARTWSLILNKARLLRLGAVNRDIMIRSLLLEGIIISFLFLAADFGDVTLAADQVLIQFLSVSAYALDGFALAAESLVGQAMGARSPRRVRRASLITSQWGLGVSILMAGCLWALGPALIDLMTTSEEVRAEARTYLPWMVLAPVVGVGSWMLDGIFIGATRTHDMRNMMLVTAIVYVVALFALVPSFGNHGLWAAILISLLVRGGTLALKYPQLERAARHG